MRESIDLDRCPTCRQPYLEECGSPWPPSLHDVTPVHCRLPRGHRSPEHWRPALWAGGSALVWVDDNYEPPVRKEWAQ